VTSRRALLRADASSRIGTGHVQRCLTLGGELRSRGWTALLAGRYPPELADLAVRAGQAVAALPDSLARDAEPAWLAEQHLLEGVDLLVTDGYDLAAPWHRAVGRHGTVGQWRPVLMAIDDLAREPLEVDLVLNQNLGADVDRYRGLVPADATILAGPQYALLRPEFAEARRQRRPRSGRVTRILVFLSGADEDDVTRRAAEAALPVDVPVDVVIGSAYPFFEDLQRWAGGHPRVRLHRNTTEMARLMAAADLAIGAPSSTSWERCTLGLPAVLVTLADNQVEVAARLADAGAAVSLGWHSEVTVQRLGDAVLDLVRDPERLRTMGRAAAAITDGGGAARVANAIEARLEPRAPGTLDAGAAR
jgi:UDP-2,4-diacetamido-2,4,6-trideoxy-beta-L-altropyranose hydrolase